MSCVEVLKIAKQLEKITSGSSTEDDALDLLKSLKSLNLTIEILQKTRIGMTVNELRKKTENEAVAGYAKTLIKAWKKLLDSKPKNGKGPEKESSFPRNDSIASDLDASSDAKLTNDASISRQDSSGRTQFPSVSQGEDGYRNKCREMILNSLRSAELPDGTHDPEELAEKIEATLLETHRFTNDKYKAAVRSRVFNLRDKKNPALRENVLTGVVSPHRFALMTSDEMASAEMKDKRTKFTKEAISEHQMSVTTGTPTDMFKCGRCKKKNCTYTQVQTRSADEPMTTFVYCRECGNRWKFC